MPLGRGRFLVARIELGANRNQLILLAVLVAVAVVLLVYQLRSGGGLGGGRGRDERVDFKARSVPVLAMEALTPVPGSTEASRRNPFIFGPRPTPTPNLTPPPTLPPRPTRGPRPTPTPNMIEVNGQLLPPPPDFDEEYIGYFGPDQRRVAVFRKGDRIEVAVAGNVIAETFVVRSVGHQGVEIGFVGYPEEVTTRVPMEEK